MLFSSRRRWVNVGLTFPANGCKTHDSSYLHSFMSACCVGVISNRPESTGVSCSAWEGGALLKIINAARLFLQGPSTELPRHRAAACVTELQFMDSLMVLSLRSPCAVTSPTFTRQTLSCYRYTVVIQLVDVFSIINSQHE